MTTPRRSREPPRRCASPSCKYLVRPPEQMCPVHSTIPEREIRMTEQAQIAEAHRQFRAALRAQPPDPTALRHDGSPPTTTRHRVRCTRSGWHVENSHTLSAVQIATCQGCGAIELRTPTPADIEAEAS
jgi:hypothetical protein